MGPAREWQREPTVFERVHAAGVPVSSVGPARFAGSGLTEAALRGGGYRRAESLADRVDVAVEELMGPALVYLYWGDVDTTGHHHGVGSWQWGEAVGELDRELARLARLLPPRTLLLVTADHGMVDVDPAGRWDVATTPSLADGVELVAGEPRALHVHTRSSAPDAVAAAAARWRETLGRAAVVATRDVAVAAGWFGPVAEHVLPAIGDLVVAATGRSTDRRLPDAERGVPRPRRRARLVHPAGDDRAAAHPPQPLGDLRWPSSPSSPGPWTAASPRWRCRWTTTTPPADAAA